MEIRPPSGRPPIELAGLARICFGKVWDGCLDSATLLEQLNDAVTRDTAGQRAEILHHITDLFVVASANYSDRQVELFDDILVCIAASIEQSARAVLAQ